jgi:hypothetical protein
MSEEFKKLHIRSPLVQNTTLSKHLGAKVYLKLVPYPIANDRTTHNHRDPSKSAGSDICAVMQ